MAETITFKGEICAIAAWVSRSEQPLLPRPRLNQWRVLFV